MSQHLKYIASFLLYLFLSSLQHLKAFGFTAYSPFVPHT